MLFRHHIRSPLPNPRHFSPSTYFGIFCTAGALVVITVYRVSTSSITQSTSLTFCSKAHRACIKQRSNLTIPNNIFRHTCLSSVKQFIKCKQCKQFQQGITRATAIFDGIFKIRRLAKRKKLSYKTRSFVCQMLPWIIDLSYLITFLEIVIVDHFFH